MYNFALKTNSNAMDRGRPVRLHTHNPSFFMYNLHNLFILAPIHQFINSE
jgi:hypothetical protein